MLNRKISNLIFNPKCQNIDHVFPAQWDYPTMLALEEDPFATFSIPWVQLLNADQSQRSSNKERRRKTNAYNGKEENKNWENVEDQRNKRSVVMESVSWR